MASGSGGVIISKSLTEKVILYSALISMFIFCAVLLSQAYSVSGGSYHKLVDRVNPDSLRLTKSKVRDWIKVRIAVAKLQKKMKANAAAYDDVIHAFYKKREALLRTRGWSVDEFNAAKERINAATSAMDMADDLAESKADYEKEVADIKSNTYFTDKQKQKMIEGMRMERTLKRKQYIKPTKADWPAVRPFRSALKQLTQWYAGNIPNPPKVE